MWFPTTTEELSEAIDAGSLPRESAAFEVKAQLPEKSKSSDIAVDVAAMATDGGVIVYGITENKSAGTFNASPVTLQGAKERISDVVSSHVRERIEFYVHELALDDDPTKGFIVVDVPASVRAPHMVEAKGQYRYYRRVPGGNSALTEAEVASLYEQRQGFEHSIPTALDKAISVAPLQTAVQRGDLHLVALPLRSDSGLRERAWAEQDHVVAQAIIAAFNALRFRDPWDPRITDIIQGGRQARTVDGISLTAQPFQAQYNNEWIYSYVARMEVLDDGTCRYFHAALAEPTERGFVVRDSAIAQMTAHFVLFSGKLLEAGGYHGPVEVLLGVIGAAGATSGAWFVPPHHFPPAQGYPAFPLDDHRDRVRVPAAKLQEEPCEVARALLTRFLRAVRPDGSPDPLQLQQA